MSFIVVRQSPLKFELVVAAILLITVESPRRRFPIVFSNIHERYRLLISPEVAWPSSLEGLFPENIHRPIIQPRILSTLVNSPTSRLLSVPASRTWWPVYAHLYRVVLETEASSMNNGTSNRRYSRCKSNIKIDRTTTRSFKYSKKSFAVKNLPSPLYNFHCLSLYYLPEIIRNPEILFTI